MQRGGPPTSHVAPATAGTIGASSADTATCASVGVHPGSGSAAGADSTPMLTGVPAVLRMQMELVACASSSPEDALQPIIEILVDGSPQKRAAIVAAITTNDPLREQWERTWEVLRG